MTQDNLLAAALGSPLIPHLKRRLERGDFLCLNAVAPAGRAFLCHLLAYVTGRPLLIVTDGARIQDQLLSDLQTFCPQALPFPAWETLPQEDILPDEQTIAERLRVLERLAAFNASHRFDFGSPQAPGDGCDGNDKPPIIVASVPALLQRTLSPQALLAACIRLAVGDACEMQSLVGRLVELGYHRQVQVSEPGDMAVRGGLVDLYPLDRSAPVRVEFFGDRIESIRTFDPVSQQSREKLTEVRFTAAGEVGFLKRSAEEAAALDAHLPSHTLLVLVEPDELAMAADVYMRRVPDDDSFHVSWAHWLRSGFAKVHITEQIAPEEQEAHINLRIGSLEAYRPLDVPAPAAEVAEESRRVFFAQIQRWQDQGYTVQVFCDTEGEKLRFEELWREHAKAIDSAHGKLASQAGQPALRRRGLRIGLGTLSRGFIWEAAKLVVVTDAEIFGRYKQRRPRRLPYSTAPVTDWHEFAEGDYVVHLHHGVARYLGLRVMDGREVLVLGYANDARLYVPLDQAHLVSRYVGVGKRIPELHELGGKLWQRQKLRAEQAIMDLAAELLEIQAMRETMPGHAFAPDTPWQREFEAMFPFEETADQLTSIAEVKRDMESPKPMDRLLCGDVGFGKTEVAMRAAFKAVMDGFQVAVLCPTTVLAEQHWNVFRERMAGFPITVEMLSRFRTPSEQRKIIERLRAGAVDIVIGTHRLLSPDVAFKNLGLVVIDEEQRFGVLHKERLKQLRKLVDVLTLSATPIPRTLYMALTGARDMSLIQTPPLNRLPVETHIVPFDERLIRQVIERELARGGQVFYLHNRVQSIEAVADRLRRLLNGDDRFGPIRSRRPVVSVAVAHGQMDEHELEDVMHRFVAGEVDVLVCTTIIESGLDIPNANTILIDRADRFGLADLYQLRGRVGRHNRQAYCYILLPRHMQLVAAARKRISAIKQYSSLGSGYKIAMRDLEIRGAGNLLGAEQSGHISNIGFELYCELLKESIARLKGQPIQRPPSTVLRLDFLGTAAHVPTSYVPESRLRMEIYRRIAQATDPSQLQSLRAELRDRFGPIPRPLALLLAAAEVKMHAAAAGVDVVESRADKIMLSSNGQYYQVDGKFPRFRSITPQGRLRELVQLLQSISR